MVLGFEELKQPKIWLSGLCEFLGVMFLIILACGSCYPYNIVRIGLIFGFTIAAMVWATAHVSGGHLNPAVSLGFLVTRKMSLIAFVVYFVCQILGALVGAAILQNVAAWPYNTTNTLCTSMPGPNMTGVQTFGVELLITFVLVWTVLATVDPGRARVGGSQALSIGLAIAIGNLWAAPLTGAGMNPARVFGPAVVSGTWKSHWAYWIGPLVGGGIAALMYDFLFAVNATPTKFKGFFTPDYNNDHYDKIGERGDDSETEELRKSGSHSGSKPGSNEASYGATKDQDV